MSEVLKDKYVVDIQSLSARIGYVHSDCGDIIFYNDNNFNGIILNNAFIIPPYSFIKFGCNRGEFNKTIFKYQMLGAATVLPENLVVIRKKYVHEMKRQNIYIDSLNFTDNGFVESDCGDITFINTGSSLVTINQAFPLAFTGASLVFECNEGELDKTIYRWQFSGAGLNSISVFRKKYI